MKKPKTRTSLTARQVEVLLCAARGACNKKVALDLNMAETTAKNHIASILHKLEVKSRAQAVWRGLELGLIPCPCKEFHIPNVPPRSSRTEVVMDMPQDPTPPDMVWLKIDDLLLCPESFEVRYKGRILELGATEFRLLHFLLRNLGRTYTRDRLLNNVWGQDIMVEERTVDVHVRRLRQELEKFGIQDIVQTIRGIGYRGIRLGVDDGHVSA